MKPDVIEIYVGERTPRAPVSIPKVVAAVGGVVSLGIVIRMAYLVCMDLLPYVLRMHP